MSAPDQELGDPAPLVPAASPGLGASGVADTRTRHDRASPPAQGSPAVGLALEPGTRILQYELIRTLGAGGMGQVFLARDTTLGRLVAIKFLQSALRSISERFLVEARTTAQLNHENIVVIHEVHELSGVPFMVLEFLEGMPFSEFVGQRPVPATRAAELMVPVVRALQRAHQVGIVHRDLKPENIFLTASGTVKVLDFGIAKLFRSGVEDEAFGSSGGAAGSGQLSDRPLTEVGTVLGTMPYMAPEQWGSGGIDPRTDFWAVGIILYQLVAGRHPLDPLTRERLVESAMHLEVKMPSVAEAVPELPKEMVHVIQRCLAKRKDDRFLNSNQLLEELEAQLPFRPGSKRSTEQSPYPGLAAFNEADADRFFGRSREIAQMLTWVRERPLCGVAGPSGAGKSSFVRAGLVPALRASGERWEAFVLRPGRQPLSALAALLQPLTKSAEPASDPSAGQAALSRRLGNEPGYLGTLLRSRAREKDTQILLFVDQFEELYTLVPDAAERRAFTRCLSGAADDPSTPLRVILAARSDFLDRLSDDRRFLEELTRGLFFLPTPSRDGLKEALTHPLEGLGYRFEDPAVIEGMLDALETTPGALPLLQFAAGRLWETRDPERGLLTKSSYEAIGGVAGALAVHADQVLQGLTPAAQKLARAVFQRLVTGDGTRDIVKVTELMQLSKDVRKIRSVVDHLVAARLLVVQTQDTAEGTAVEIVHESLVTSWPTLRRWLDEDREDAVFLAQLRTASKQWLERGRPEGLLWRGEAMEEALLWRRLSRQELSGREKEFLDAIFGLATRATRRKRALAIATIVLLAAVVVAAGAALFVISRAEREANRQMLVAAEEAKRALAAEKKISEQLGEIRAKERARFEAQEVADQASAEVVTTKENLKLASEKLEEALEASRIAQENAEKEAERAKEAQLRAEQAAAEAKKERERAHKLNRELKSVRSGAKKKVTKTK